MSSRLKPICRATQVRRKRSELPRLESVCCGRVVGEARIPELHCGRETEEQAGGERGGDGENEHAPVERRGERAPVGGGAGHPVNQQMQSLGSDEEPERRSENSQEQAFREELAKDLAAGCAQGEAHGEFAHPARRRAPGAGWPR